MSISKNSKIIATTLMVAMLSACATNGGNTSTTSSAANPVARNTTIGAGSGAALGGIIGAAVSKDGKKNEGALIGVALGGLLGGVVGNQYGQKLEAQLDKLKGILNGTNSTATKQDDGSVKINLAGDMSFNSGSATIKESFVDTLDKVAKVLSETPNSRVVVVGHTDGVGNAEANQRLSLARANSVRDFLATSGVSATRITASGRGSSQQLVADEKTEADRAKNRRVEVFVFPESK